MHPPTLTHDNRTTIVWPGRNSLNNRFIHAPKNGDLAPILFVDDDLLLNEDIIERMNKTFLEDERRIIGSDCRFFDGKKYIVGKHKCNIIPGRTMMFKSSYINLLTKKWQDMIDNGDCKNCDDLVFNFLVYNKTRVPPAVVNSKGVVNLNDVDGLSKAKNWINRRGKCCRTLSHMLSDMKII